MLLLLYTTSRMTNLSWECLLAVSWPNSVYILLVDAGAYDTAEGYEGAAIGCLKLLTSSTNLEWEKLSFS